MIDREIPFDERAICDDCGAAGAFDFMGDCLCPECAKRVVFENEDDPLFLEQDKQPQRH